jgi:hypothetical protein
MLNIARAKSTKKKLGDHAMLNMKSTKLVKLSGGENSSSIEMSGKFNSEVLDFLRS